MIFDRLGVPCMGTTFCPGQVVDSQGDGQPQGGRAFNHGHLEVGRSRAASLIMQALHPTPMCAAPQCSSGTYDRPPQGHTSPGWMKILPSPISPHAVAAAMMRTIAFTCECECECECECVCVCVTGSFPLACCSQLSTCWGPAPYSPASTYDETQLRCKGKLPFCGFG